MKALRRVTIAGIVLLLGWALLVRWGLLGDDRAPVALRSKVSPFRLPVVGSPGRTLALDELRGRGVLLNFWATWCEPCIEELPLLQQLQRRYGGLQFTVLGVTDDDLPAVRAFLEKRPLDWPVLHDAGGRLRRRFNADVLPYTVYIGPDGRLAGAVAGVVAEGPGTVAVERLVALARDYQTTGESPPAGE